MSKQPAKNLLDFDIEPVAPPNISQQRQPTITKLPQQQFNPAANSAPTPAQQRFTQTSYPQQANYAPAHPQQPQAHPPASAYQAQFYQQQQHLQQQQSPQVYQQQHFPQQVQQQHLQNVQQHQQPFYGAPQQFQPIGQQSQKPKSLNPFDEDFELPQPVLQKQLPVQPQQPSMQQARTVQPVVQQQSSVQQQQSSVQQPSSQQARTVQQPVVQPAVLSAFTPNPANQQAFVPRQGPLAQANSHVSNGSTLPQQVTPSVQKPPQQVSAVGVGQPQQKPAVVAPAQRPLPSANPVQQRPVKSVNEFETKETRVQEAEAPAWEDTWKKNSVDKDTLQSKDSDFKNLKASNFAPFAQNTNWRKK